MAKAKRRTPVNKNYRGCIYYNGKGTGCHHKAEFVCVEEGVPFGVCNTHLDYVEFGMVVSELTAFGIAIEEFEKHPSRYL